VTDETNFPYGQVTVVHICVSLFNQLPVLDTAVRWFKMFLVLEIKLVTFDCESLGKGC